MKYKIQASSLSNAIFVCLMISILCGSLVLISHYKNLFQLKTDLQNEIIIRNTSALNYFLSNYNDLQYGEFKSFDLIDDEIVSFAKKKSWGFYSTLTVGSVFKTDTVLKTVLVGQKSNSKDPLLAIYATNYDKPVKLSGSVEISGDLKVPIGRVEEAYLNGSIGNKIKLTGRQAKSEKVLPKLDINLSVNSKNSGSIFIDEIKEDTYNSFFKETKIIDVTGSNSIQNLKLLGNYILTSNNEIKISSTSVLKDILIIAPSVIVKSGFRGNVQIQAKTNVIIEENVVLEYPSSIYVSNSSAIKVEIEDNSTVVGGIVVDGVDYKNSLETELLIGEKAKVVGTIYCYGKTQLQGELIGRIYTDRFFLKTKSSSYENVIKDAKINSRKLVSEFIELPLFNTLNNTYEVLKTL